MEDKVAREAIRGLANALDVTVLTDWKNGFLKAKEAGYRFDAYAWRRFDYKIAELKKRLSDLEGFLNVEYVYADTTFPKYVKKKSVKSVNK